jgi:Cu(I)/Ag(I) efflux system membrane fusion protein
LGCIAANTKIVPVGGDMFTRTRALWSALFILGAIIGFSLSPILRGQSSNSNSAAEKEILYWVAPMDPNFRSDSPGKSPMGMDLTPVYASSEDPEDGIQISSHVTNTIGVRTAKAMRMDLIPTLRSVGFISYNKDEVTHLHARADGWVEKLHVQSEGNHVEKGDLLFEYFSPSISNAVFEHIRELGRSPKGATQTRAKLLSLGVSDRQIRSLSTKSSFDQLIKYYAPRTGVISKLSARQGMHLTPNMEALAITDLSTVWIMTEVFESQAKQVFLGMTAKARLTQIEGREWTGTVDLIYPELDPKTRTLRLRIRMDNADGFLKPNMIADINLQTKPIAKAVAVPSEAVIRTGRGSRVVISMPDGRFKSVPVKAGAQANGLIEITEGIAEGQVVVSSGNFLIDSESNQDASFGRMEPSQSSGEEPAPPTDPQKLVWGIGTINTVDTTSNLVNLSHDPIPEIGWPAMVMDMTVMPSVDLTNLTPNTNVSFALMVGQDNVYMVAKIEPLGETEGMDQ